MKKLAVILLSIALGLLLLSLILVNNHGVQDFLLKRAALLLMSTTVVENPIDALRIFVCGSSSPLPDPERAQACIAVITPQHFFVIDSGAGSTGNLMAAGLPLNRLDGVLLTHFHSDHIAELYEVNLNSWVQGRPDPLTIYGPAGVDEIVDGLNLVYRQDVVYRVEHHGEELLPPRLGKLMAKLIVPGVIVDTGELKITAFAVDHRPVTPAVGYRIDYKGRSAVVTGDTIVSTELEKMVVNLDLLLSDTLSLPVMEILSAAARESGRDRNAKILKDVTAYHAHKINVVKLSKKAGVQLTGLYHLVPPPRNFIIEKFYQRDLPGNIILTEDNMWFTLRVGETGIDTDYP
ncbi:MAG: MBL fold metallo-hydrolase [bacterium]|nr:MBL fold metallo-hydrolase [Gammaproteobacteria bacterium]HIL96903.1 MBL fold metallo-hydrolase [Pseudomonadales bacterium]